MWFANEYNSHSDWVKIDPADFLCGDRWLVMLFVLKFGIRQAHKNMINSLKWEGIFYRVASRMWASASSSRWVNYKRLKARRCIISLFLDCDSIRHICNQRLHCAPSRLGHPWPDECATLTPGIHTALHFQRGYNPSFPQCDITSEKQKFLDASDKSDMVEVSWRSIMFPCLFGLNM